MREAFSLDPGVTHVNHGSFGTVPIVVQEAQARVRARAEANPQRFHRVERDVEVARARERGAAFLQVPAHSIALVRNVTESIATVLSHLSWGGGLASGDVVLVGEQGYGAVQLAVQHWCSRTGARTETVPTPADSTDEQVVRAHRDAVDRVEAAGERVRLVVIDHVASPTARVLPVAGLVALAKERDALTFVDAAHVPGQLPALPGESGADYWTGTWHKWAFAPRGTSALWVAQQHRERFHPLATGWNHGQPFPAPFDLQGTDDDSAWLSLGAALDFWQDAGGPQIAERASDLLEQATVTVTGALASAGLTPTTSPATGPLTAPQLRLVALPDGVATTGADADALYEALSARRVETQIVAHAGRGWIRITAAPYNAADDYGRLADALVAELATG